jgi:hypothetical protein
MRVIKATTALVFLSSAYSGWICRQGTNWDQETARSNLPSSSLNALLAKRLPLAPDHLG